MAFHGTNVDVARPTRTRSASPSRRRAATYTLGLVGRDLADRAPAMTPRRVLPALIAVLVVALGVAALRTELLRLRYALAEATLEEQRLLDEERALKAQRRRLRDPVHLARRAGELGFVRPENLVDLPAPSARGERSVLADATAPQTRRPGRP
jgi:hypothetical protein